MKNTTLSVWFAALVLVFITSISNAAQSVTLAWDPVPEPDVVSYEIHYGLSSRNYTSSTNVGNVTTATVYGLAEGVTHYFAITARNTSGLVSDFSNEVTNSIPSNVTNNVPTIDSIPDVVLNQGGSTNLVFNIWDIETNPSNLIVAATSTNTDLLLNENIVIQGTSFMRELTLSVTPGVSGKTMVTVVVSDGSKASSTSFIVSVVPVPPTKLYIVSNLQFSFNRMGPWTNVLTTIMPIEMSTQGFYRTWLDVSP